LRSFRIGTLAGGICRVAMNAVPFLLPLMLQVGFGMSPIASGSITFVSSISSVFMRLLSSRLLPRYGFDRILIGSAIAGSAALAGFAILEPGMPHWALLLYVFVFGLTRSIQFMTSNTLSYADMPNERLSRATSLGGALQQLSVSFGVTLSAVLLSAVSIHDRLLTPARFHEVFLLTAVLPLLAIPVFMRLRPEDGAQVSGYRSLETRED
ncbi:MAG TPA: MFS transporter, partial [Steroidobacteraceae bacterium]